MPLLLAPTPVQGEGAARSIIAALRAVAAVPDVDVVILARGGGSLEDLWCFNDEGLARAIAACRVPVISAVGHETDFTIADFVADLRAPTPSAAAEIAVPVAAELHAELAVLQRRLARGVLGDIRSCTLALERARARLGDPRRLVDERRQLLDDLLAARGARPAHGAWPAGGRRCGPRRRGCSGPTPAAHRRAAPRPAGRWSAGWRSASRARAGPAAPAAATGCWASWRRCRRWRCWSAATAWPGGPTATSSPGGPSCTPGDAVQLRFRDGEVRHPGRGRRAAGNDAGEEQPMIRGAVLGGDVSRSRSPGIHAAAFRALGKAGSYDAFSRRRRRVPRRWCERLGDEGYDYLNVTIPHKRAAAGLADGASPLVRSMAAANTLMFRRSGGRTRVRAENTDGYGLLAALGDLGVTVRARASCS